MTDAPPAPMPRDAGDDGMTDAPPAPSDADAMDADADAMDADDTDAADTATADDDGGCLIATAAYGTEMAPQVQALREVRDAALLQSGSGAAFMSGFSAAYYAFSPAVADLERENPVFRGAVALLIAPMVATLSVLMPMADGGSEASILLYGIASMAAIAGIYVAAPAYAVHRVRLSLAARGRARTGRC